MDIIDIMIAKSKAQEIDPSDISSAGTNYLDDSGIQSEIDGMAIDIDGLKLTDTQKVSLVNLLI